MINYLVSINGNCLILKLVDRMEKVNLAVFI